MDVIDRTAFVVCETLKAARLASHLAEARSLSCVLYAAHVGLKKLRATLPSERCEGKYVCAARGSHDVVVNGLPSGWRLCRPHAELVAEDLRDGGLRAVVEPRSEETP